MSELRILLIEDSVADAELAKVRLRGVGEVEHGNSLSAALARLAQLVRDAANGRGHPRIPRVLLLEDSHGDAVLAQRALEAAAARFELTIARSLREGIDRLAQGFDAILLDLTLPDCVGPETVARMRAAAGELPIVVLSGADEGEVADRCFRAGASAYQEKGASIRPRCTTSSRERSNAGVRRSESGATRQRGRPWVSSASSCRTGTAMRGRPRSCGRPSRRT